MSSYFSQLCSSSDVELNLNAPHSMRTTIIGVTYDGGVVIGADSRTSTGLYVVNRASVKITEVTDNVYLCRSGSAADSQAVSDYVRHFLDQHNIQLGQPATVKVAANLIRLLSYNKKKLVVKAVSLAIVRDGASGCVVRTVIINSEGVTKIFYPPDALPLWHEELEPVNSYLDVITLSNPVLMFS